jgi:DNA-damage-inducible protein J
MIPITAKVDPREKERFSELVREVGMTPAGAIRVFISAFNAAGHFPFDIRNPSGFNQETLDAMRDSLHGVDDNGPFSADEARAFLCE